MKNKLLLIFLISLTLITGSQLFTGRVLVLDPQEYDKYPFKMTASYDTTCEKEPVGTFVFKKGDVMATFELPKNTIDSISGHLFQQPEHTVHLHIADDTTAVRSYRYFLQVYPNGELTTYNTPFVKCLSVSGDNFKCEYIKGACVVKNDRPLFSDYK